LPKPSLPLPAFDSLDAVLYSPRYQRRRQAYADAREYIRVLTRLGGKEALARLLRELKRQPFEHCLNTVFRLSISDFEHPAGQ